MGHSGDPQKEREYYNSYYGKGPIIGNLGPFLSDVFTAAELTDFLNLTSDEYAQQRKLNYDPNDPDWWYQVSRIFNIQGSRTFYKTIPALAKSQWEKAFRLETGMFKPKWITKWRKKMNKNLFDMSYNKTDVLPDINFSKKKKKTKKVDNNRKLQRQKALAALSNF